MDRLLQIVCLIIVIIVVAGFLPGCVNYHYPSDGGGLPGDPVRTSCWGGMATTQCTTTQGHRTLGHFSYYNPYKK